MINCAVQYLERHGIRPILNYAAEDDVSGSQGAEAAGQPGGSDGDAAASAAERALDRNLATFLRSVADSDNARNRAFVAAKVAPLSGLRSCGS